MSNNITKCFFCGKLVGGLEIHDCLHVFTEGFPGQLPPMTPPPVLVWQCPGCKTYYTSDVQKCECDRVTR